MYISHSIYAFKIEKLLLYLGTCLIFGIRQKWNFLNDSYIPIQLTNMKLQ